MLRLDLIVFGLVLTSTALPACGGDLTGSCSGSQALPVTAVDNDSRLALPSPLVAYEINGLQSASPSPDGNYVFGGQGNTDGLFSLPLPCGKWGVHIFANGYQCQSNILDNDSTLQVGLVALDSNAVVPVVGNAVWSDDAPKASSQQTLTVTTQAASQATADVVAVVLAVETVTHKAFRLALMDAASSVDGVTYTWQATVILPGEAGSYSYDLVAATEACVASKILRLQLSTSP